MKHLLERFKTESIRKLSNFNFQQTKTLYQNNLSHLTFFFRLCANGRNIVDQQLPKLVDVTCCIRLHTLLYVVGCCCVLLCKVWNQSNFSANNSQHFFCSVIAEAYCKNVGSACTALPTLVGPSMLITHGLQRLMGCILPMMHCSFQHCWELLHPFAHHCQHARNNSQHCWRNNVSSCCVCLHAALHFSQAIDVISYQ